MKIVIRTVACLSLLAASSGAFAADKVCKVEIAGTDQMSFDKKEIVIAPDCTSVELTLKHTGKMTAAQMGHNWVLTNTADVAAVANDGMMAGVANDYIKKGETRVIAHTKIVGGGQSTAVTFPTSKLKKGGAYTYFCSFPGHSGIMRGTLKF
jgi:azurin